MKNRIITLLLAITFIGVAFASDTNIGDIWYNFDSSTQTASVTYCGSYTNTAAYAGNIVIPSKVTYQGVVYDVTGIGNYAFYLCTNLSSVVIPNSVTSIGHDSFNGCTKLSSIDIPGSVTSIDALAFENCTSLSYVSLPNSVTDIGNYAFSGCTGITTPIYNSRLFVYLPTSYSGAYVIPDGIETIVGTAFRYCETLTAVSLPNCLKKIGNGAFYGCSALSAVTIPIGVESIEDKAFYACPISTVTIPNTVTMIGKEVFNESTVVFVEPIYNAIYVQNPDIIELDTIKAITNAVSISIDDIITSPAFSCVSDLTVDDIMKTEFGWITRVSYTYSGWSSTKVLAIKQDPEFSYIRATLEENQITHKEGSGPLLQNAYMHAAYELKEPITDIFCQTGYKLGRADSHLAITLYEGQFQEGDIINIYTTNNGDIGDSFYLYSDKDGNNFITGIRKQSQAGIHSLQLDSTFIPLNTICLFRHKGSTQDMNPHVAYMEIVRAADFNFGPCVIASGKCGADKDSANLTWTLTCDSVLSIQGSGEMGTYDGVPNPNGGDIGDDIGDAPRRKIMAESTGRTPWEEHKQSIREVRIEEGLTAIGQGAFYECKNLTSVMLPTTIKHIRRTAFWNCTRLYTLSLPAGVLQLDDMSFEYCTGLSSISCEAINPPLCGANAFRYVDKSIPLYVPAESIELYKEAEGWKEFFNILSISEMGHCLLASGTCGENLTWELSCDSVLTISGEGEMTNFAWDAVPWRDYKTAIKEVTMDDRIINIGDYAFSGCSNLISILISKSVTSIGQSAFSSCSNISSLSLPDGLINISGYAFINCTNLSSISIPNSVTTLRGGAFFKCTSLESIIIPDKITSLEQSTFIYCENLKSVIIGQGVESIWNECFVGCTSLVSIFIPQNVTYIGYRVFSDCNSLQSIIVDENSKYFCSEDGVLYDKSKVDLYKYPADKSLTSYVIFPSVVNIKSDCFNSATSLESIDIPSSCANIDCGAFRNCTGLISLICRAIDPPVGCKDIFNGIDLSIPLYVPAESIELYKSTYPWNNFTNILPITIPCESYEFVEDTTIYVGDEFTWHRWHIQAEEEGSYLYLDSLMTYLGCDSVYVLNLEVKPRSQKMCSWLVESNDLEMGVVTTSFTEPNYLYGTQITVEASPNSGYKFVKWNDGKKYNPYKFSLLDDKYLLAIFMEEEEEQDTTTVDPTSTTATFTWPFIFGGFTYTLTIYLDVFCTIPLCTLTFNQFGQLIAIHFGSLAPRRMPQEDGFTYTITGLDENTTYYYRMETRNEDNKLINTDEGSFKTLGETMKIDNLWIDNVEPQKVLHNGQIFILRGDKVYTVTGQELK